MVGIKMDTLGGNRMSVQDKRGAVDRLLQKVTSRKLLVWVTGTVFLVLGDISPDEWMALSLAYVGTAAVIDAAVAWKHGP